MPEPAIKKISIMEDEILEESIHEVKGDNLKENAVINAENDVVAIILSSIMGSIIDKWELKTTNENQSEIIYQVEEEPMQSESCFKDKSADRFSLSEHKRYLMDSQQAQITGSEQNITNPVYMSEYKGGDSMKTLSFIEGKESRIKLDGFNRGLRSLLENQKDEIFGWSFLETDDDVVIKFKQGNRYEGKLLNCRMQGIGKFFWADGSVYEGKFVNGEMTGDGRLQWADQSWYEGQLRRGLRHGRGLYVSRPMFYSGEWRCGLRYGVGTMFYSGAYDSSKNFYSGEWVADHKEGTGLRSYPSGAMYSGQWKDGVRHGLGTMVWTNDDVYSGNWSKGRIHGYGEYTWDSFFNSQLVMPLENCYYGSWKNNTRHGNGTLETSMGVIVKGTWLNGMKNGPAEVICRNGSFLYSNNLFTEDCIYLPLETSMDTDSLDGTMKKHLHKLPVNAANHDIDLKYYCDKLKNYIAFCKETGKEFGKTVKNNVETTSTNMNKFELLHVKKETEILNIFPNDEIDYNIEEGMLRCILLQNLATLKLIYTMYAELCCQVKPTFSPVMMRLMLWQLFRNWGLHKKGLSLADLDILIAENRVSLVEGVHYPFERIYFWQFLHCLIEISWEIYGKTSTSSSRILAQALHQLIKQDIFPNSRNHIGNVLHKHRDLLSMDSVYWFYRGIGEPHSARKFILSVFRPSENFNDPSKMPEYPGHQIRGKNILGVCGKLIYYPEDKPLIPDTPITFDANHPQDLSCLKDIGLLSVFDSIVEICPSIKSGGMIVNMDYKIVFLEFFEILLLCAKVKYQKQLIKKEEIINSPVNVSSNENVLGHNKEAEEKERKPSKKAKSSLSSNTKKKKK